ncbi:MAG: hypothetical protein U5J83_02135 [Bryobacterales bacterium]|nr:hypothetical protein [Bryobacterales bacterium]
MRLVLAIAFIGMSAASSLLAQIGSPEQERPVQATTVLNATVDIPPNDLRRVRLPRLSEGAIVLVEFRPAAAADGPRVPVEIEILRRDELGKGKVGYRSMRPSLLAMQGELNYRVPEDGDYVVALRQAGRASRPARVTLHVQLRQPAAPPPPPVKTLSREKRIAVTVFSLGFLWTTLAICGVPLIRAFRSRRRRPSPPWFA